MIKNKSISIIILTLNEEKNITRCIESSQWAGEVVVLDSGSTDETLKIAKKLGAKTVVHIPQKFMYYKQRNWALKNINLKGEWVLFLDADEVIPPLLAENIRTEINEANKNVVGFRLAPKIIFLGKWVKHASGYPRWHDRLIKKDSGVIFENKYGTIEGFNLNGKNYQIKNILPPYIHYAFSHGISKWIEKHNWISTIEAEEAMCVDYNKFNQRRFLANHIFLGPSLRFFFYYIVRRGFLDGLAGIIYSLVMAMFQFFTCLKVKEIKNLNQKDLSR